MKKLLLLFVILCMGLTGFSQYTRYERFRTRPELKYVTKSDIQYYSEQLNTGDKVEKCRLDIYYPEGVKGFPTIVWFHGGGLTGGDKTQEYPHLLKENGVCIVNVNYRMYPDAKCPDYIEDAAAAIAWTFKNIESYGGDPELIFVSGHSAGGYLTSIVGMDKQWLAAHNVDANEIAGLLPLSGHVITHFNIRKERGIPNGQPVVDEFAPLFHVRADAPPLVLITGDRELELLGRYEENAYMARMMKHNGHKETYLHELQGFDHEMEEPASFLILEFIYETCQKKNKLRKPNE
ncbi:MAG: alpha/beta hydrolase [Bacteroidales bacterium]|nr:alpha/beta hydrolase [Bacteroidales bacterium]